ncbi:cellulose biosynthesis protein BcsQ [Halomonas sp. HP20-15]|uniref:cellulose biosynthesis protein BcsQ n=1 Tax=Halomonas sp. HP20-15 TaxID=3085901 RepID=UPI002981DDDF|nr:cellulose biosynthesis protein BcsQ [Halomonas sp. HP20-15]MDW5377126.1 cellulose biosynthesis protein BcsQ [Halomonas sp. HP20-15]
MALQGLRGGTGTTSLLAALAESLTRAGHNVLCIDLDPRNQLRLHFNHPWQDDSGWAVAERADAAWHEMAFSLGDRLTFLPYGCEEGIAEPLEPDWREVAHVWSQRLAQLDPQRYDWILIDIPNHSALPRQMRNLASLWLTVVNADAACHALLAKHPIGVDEYLLINRFSPRSLLQNDLLAVWQRRHADWLVPCSIHQDEAMFEALAHKRSVLGHRSDSLASRDVQRLAAWLQTRGTAS